MTTTTDEYESSILSLATNLKLNTMNEMLDFIDTELSILDRGIVATPDTGADLERFANANGGSCDLLLMQMAKNYGYKIALLNMLESIKSE
jgi:hypothetical protein